MQTLQIGAHDTRPHTAVTYAGCAPDYKLNEGAWLTRAGQARQRFGILTFFFFTSGLDLFSREKRQRRPHAHFA